MPTYEYHCPDCNHEFERFQSITAKPVKTCPECGKRKVQRLISNTSFILKGGGWYADGYADKKGGADKKEKKESASGGGTSGTSSSDAKSGGSSGTSDSGAKKKSDGGSKASSSAAA